VLGNLLDTYLFFSSVAFWQMHSPFMAAQLGSKSPNCRLSDQAVDQHDALRGRCKHGMRSTGLCGQLPAWAAG